MNAIEENEFVAGFRRVAADLPPPAAILCISAHWETRGTQLTAMAQPPTIHDFGGFPQALFEVQYPAPGSPALVQLTDRKSTRLNSSHVRTSHAVVGLKKKHAHPHLRARLER